VQLAICCFNEEFIPDLKSLEKKQNHILWRRRGDSVMLAGYRELLTTNCFK